jgi:hypothetical protein
VPHVFTLSCVLFHQGKLETAESEVVQLMDILYAKIDDQRLPDDLKATLETKVQYTNDSLQVFFSVSGWRFEGGPPCLYVVGGGPGQCEPAGCTLGCARMAGC